MNKGDLVNFVSEKVGLTKKDSEQAVAAVFEGIRVALETKEGLGLAGFGNFYVVEKPARIGRNPKTGAAIEISASIQVKFKPGKNLKDALNRPG